VTHVNAIKLSMIIAVVLAAPVLSSCSEESDAGAVAKHFGRQPALKAAAGKPPARFQQYEGKEKLIRVWAWRAQHEIKAVNKALRQHDFEEEDKELLQEYEQNASKTRKICEEAIQNNCFDLPKTKWKKLIDLGGRNEDILGVLLDSEGG